MHRIITALLGVAFGVASLGAAPSTTPDPEPEIRACQRRCASIEDETNRATCRLNCREATEEKDRAHIIRWKKERSIGGGVAGETPPPATVTTVTKVTPRGTTTESNAPAPETAPATRTSKTIDARSPRQRYYFGLVGCQERCDPIGVDIDRARCKLRCLRQRPGPPPPRTSPTPRRTPAPSVAAPPSPSPLPTDTAPAPHPKVDCGAQCANEATQDDRMTCEAQCDSQQQRNANPTTQYERTSVSVGLDECRRLCAARAGRCRQACTSAGSDGSTCRLQCDEASRACTRRCG